MFSPASARGFTLVELVVGLVITAIAMTFLSVVFFNSPERSVEPIFQIRASELGQSLMDEILAKPYDENTPLGGIPPCTSCTSSLGSEEGGNRQLFDDVDDYDFYCRSAAPYADVEDAFGNTPNDFENFKMSICVIYDGNYDGTADSNQNAKLITIDIYPPAIGGVSQPISFRAYRGNF